MELESLLVEMTKHIHKSDYDAAREMIKSLVLIGLSDSELAREIMDA